LFPGSWASGSTELRQPLRGGEEAHSHGHLLCQSGCKKHGNSGDPVEKDDANIEMTSKKSAAQKVEAIYGLQDKTQAEMDLILTPEVIMQRTFKELREWKRYAAGCL
jgi:hypothetical protein